MTEAAKPAWLEGYTPKPTANGGRWQKGQSGNPKGRPPGRPDRRTKLSRALADDAAAVVRVVLDAAKEGDMQACNMVLARVAPALRPQAERVAFELDPSAPIPTQIESVIAAVADGVLAPDVGQTIIASLGTLADARAVTELEQRIANLEGEDRL